jgi:hypothetical protein
MNKRRLGFGIMILSALAVGLPLTVGADETAESIIRQVDERQSSSSEVSEITMTVIDDLSNPDDRKVFRLESFSRNSEGDGELSVYFFREPRRLAGLSILTRDDGQWVYFPSTGRVRLLSGAARSGSVNGVGGDFSYEDLGSGNWAGKYAFTIQASTPDVWVLEGRPLSEDVNYSKIIMQVHREDYIPRRIDFYKGKSTVEKYMTVPEVRSYSGRLSPASVEMVNPSKNSKTIIEFHDIQYDKALEDHLFHPRQFYR